MKFTPKSEKEIAEERLLPDGQYGFVISGAVEKTSKAGNEMIELTLRVYKPDGGFILVNDYLMESIAYKLRHASEVCGLLPKYESGELDSSEFIGKEGFCNIKTQKDKTGTYPDRNSVADYVVSEDKFSVPKDNIDKMLSKDDLDDEIPF